MNRDRLNAGDVLIVDDAPENLTILRNLERFIKWRILYQLKESPIKSISYVV